MLELLVIFQDAFAQLANDTVSISSPLVQHAATSLIDQVDTTTTTAQVGGIVGTIGAVGIAAKTFFDRRNNTKVTAKVSEIDMIQMQDMIDNYNDFRLWLNIEKQMQDLAKVNPTLSYNQLLDLVYDVSTGETMGQRRAKFVIKINEYYTSYYQASNIKSPEDLLNKSPLDKTLGIVKDKTTPS